MPTHLSALFEGLSGRGDIYFSCSQELGLGNPLKMTPSKILCLGEEKALYSALPRSLPSHSFQPPTRPSSLRGMVRLYLFLPNLGKVWGIVISHTTSHVPGSLQWSFPHTIVLQMGDYIMVCKKGPVPFPPVRAKVENRGKMVASAALADFGYKEYGLLLGSDSQVQ